MDYLLLASAIAPTVVLLWMFITSDEFPEPTSVILKTFVLGALTIPLLFGVFWFLDPVLEFFTSTNPYVAGIGTAFFVAAIPEECVKFAVLRGYAIPHREFDEPMDGIVYGVTISLGFATLENILYVLDGGYDVALMRAVTAVPCHAMLGALMGYYAGRATFAKYNKRSLYVKALGFPILLHGLYDVPPLIWKSARELDVVIPDWMDYALGLLFINILYSQIRFAAKATGTLRAKQRLGRIPRFFFEGTRRMFPKSTPVEQEPKPTFEEEMAQLGEEAMANLPTVQFSRVFAALYACASIGCLAGLIVRLVQGDVSINEIWILGILSGVFGMFAMHGLVGAVSTASTRLEHARRYPGKETGAAD